jgi:hypothetical protein
VQENLAIHAYLLAQIGFASYTLDNADGRFNEDANSSFDVARKLCYFACDRYCDRDTYGSGSDGSDQGF